MASGWLRRLVRWLARLLPCVEHKTWPQVQQQERETATTKQLTGDASEGRTGEEIERHVRCDNEDSQGEPNARPPKQQHCGERIEKRERGPVSVERYRRKVVRQPTVPPNIEHVNGASSKKAHCEQDQDWSCKLWKGRYHLCVMAKAKTGMIRISFINLRML
jgi:hypothetical protein